MAGLDAQRRRPDSSSQLNRGMIPKTPLISLNLLNIWTRDQIYTVGGEESACIFQEKFPLKYTSCPNLKVRRKTCLITTKTKLRGVYSWESQAALAEMSGPSCPHLSTSFRYSVGDTEPA